MQSHSQPHPFTRPDAAAAPSSPTSLTAPLLLRAHTEASPTSGIESLPSPAKVGDWRDHAVAMLRGRADVRAMRPLDDAVMVPLLALPTEAVEMRISPAASGDSLVDTTDAEQHKTQRWLAPSNNVVSPAEPTCFTAANAVDQTAIKQPDAQTTQALTDHARRIAHFLAEVDGPHLYLNCMRSALHMRQQQPDFGRYLNDVLLGRWLAEYVDALAQVAIDEFSAVDASACEELGNWQFKRLANRLGYLDGPSLLVVSDQGFVEQYVLEGASPAVQNGLAAAFTTLREWAG